MIALLLLWVQESPEPRIGYAYPAGGRQGTVVRMLVGGQNFSGVRDVFVSGAGVKGTIVRYMGRTIQINGDERKEVVRRLREIKDGKTPTEGTTKLPNHPLLNDLEKLSPMEVDFLVNEFLKFDMKKQPNAQIRETALVEITIDADAPPGDRELRLRGALGLTNPVVFQVGALPETVEPAPYDENAIPAPAVDAPVTLNGQIKPGDVDRFKFRAVKGSALVIQAHARRLIPFIADAVPGWFQAVVTVFDAKGKELAYADDYRYDPDPVLLFKVPETGEYEIEVHDSLYRGREDFVYRIHIAEQPFVKSVFPLGGREGAQTVATADGWNLKDRTLALDTSPGSESIRQAGGVTYAVDPLPDCVEVEPNDAVKNAQAVELPRIVNGRIGAAGDEDVFRFSGKADEEIVAEVLARRLLSPLDSLVQLLDSSGAVIAWNDDLERKDGDLRTDMGAITHHADSYLRAKLPKDGVYCVRLSDAQRQGGEGFAYRLRLGPPRPEVSVRVTPSTFNLRQGVAYPIDVHVLRSDGFQGEVTLTLKDAPASLKLQGAVVPAGVSHIRMTLTIQEALAEPVPVRFQAQGRAVAPCEDSMQAFLWRHLVPVREFVAVTVGGGGRAKPPEVSGPAHIPNGGTAEVLVKIDPRGKTLDWSLELTGAPKGITIVEQTPVKEGVKLTFKAEGAEVGTAGNLIVGVYVEAGGKRNEARKRRVAVGALPAIPYKVVP